MRLAIAFTLAFFGVVSGMGAYRDLLRSVRDPRPLRYLGTLAAVIVSAWSLYAAYWTAFH